MRRQQTVVQCDCCKKEATCDILTGTPRTPIQHWKRAEFIDLAAGGTAVLGLDICSDCWNAIDNFIAQQLMKP